MMPNPKFIDIVKSLSDSEVTSLRKYLSGKFDKSQDAYVLFYHIVKYKEKENKVGKVEVIQKEVLPHLTVKSIANLLSDLYLHAEEWMVQMQINEESFTKDLYVLRWLNKKGIYNIADQVTNKLDGKIKGEKLLDIEVLQVKNELLYNKLIANNPSSFSLDPSTFDDLIDSYEELVSAQLLIYKSELINFGNLKNYSYQDSISKINELTEQLKSTSLTQILKSLSELIESNKLKSLEFLISKLFNQKIKPKSELHFIVCSYCMSKALNMWSKGISKNKNLIPKLAKYILESGAYEMYGKIPLASFHNLINGIAPFSKLEEVNFLIEKFIDKVSTKNSDATISLAKAQNLFYHNKFDMLSRYCYRTDFETFNQKNMAQCLHTVCTFMNRNSEPEMFKKTLSLSFNFIKRNKQLMSKHAYDSLVNLYYFMDDWSKNKKEINLDNIKPLRYRYWCEHILITEGI